MSKINSCIAPLLQTEKVKTQKRPFFFFNMVRLAMGLVSWMSSFKEIWSRQILGWGRHALSWLTSRPVWGEAAPRWRVSGQQQSHCTGCSHWPASMCRPACEPSGCICICVKVLVIQPSQDLPEIFESSMTTHLKKRQRSPDWRATYLTLHLRKRWF